MVGVNGNNNLIPEKFELKQNYPNPFNPETKISFSLPQGSTVKIIVTDISGRVVSEPVNGYYPSGNHTTSYSGTELASGIYFYTLQAGSFTETKKMLLVK